MTLAGTRPPTVDEWDKYELHHRARLATKPGLTGMWQVKEMEIFKSIVTNVLTALYQPFWFAVLLTIFILFFYMYAYQPTDVGKGIKTACLWSYITYVMGWRAGLINKNKRYGTLFHNDDIPMKLLLVYTD